MDVARVPGIRRVDVVGAGGGDADEIGDGAQQNIVAGPRPWLVEVDDVMGVDAGVVEEIQRHPALAGGNAVGVERAVEIVGAVDVARIAHVLVEFGVAGERERVVAADRVLHDLDQRLHVLVEAFGRQAGGGIAEAGQAPRRRRVERKLLALVELAGGKALEIGALAAGDVDDLDVFAGADEIGFRRRPVHADVLQRIGERLRQHDAVLRRRAGWRARSSARSAWRCPAPPAASRRRARRR